MVYFSWVEDSAFSIWMRESNWGFFGALILHSLAMGLTVGINVAVALRVLGMAPGVPLSLMSRFYRPMWVGGVLVLLSGMLLLLAYPAKALTNPVFYIKIVGIIAALAISRHFLTQLMTGDRRLDHGTLPVRIRWLAVAALVLWCISIGAGRFLAYTYSVLLASSVY